MLLVCILLVSQTWNIVRLSSFSGILIACLYSILISELLSNNRVMKDDNKRALFAKNGIIVAVIALTIFGQFYLSRISYLRYNSQQDKNATFPIGVVNYLKEYRSKGNIFNLYSFGGYLAYALPRGFKTYIDGRTNTLFSIDFYRKFLEAVYSPSTLRSEVEKYGIEYAILDNDPKRYELISQSKVFTIDYVDHYFFLATTGAANFPISGDIFMQPACWDGVLIEDLSKEIERGAQILPTHSPLLEIQKQLDHYFKLKENSKFHEELDVGKIDHDQTRRVLGYQASRNGFQAKAIKLFYSINKKITKDVLAIAMAFIKLEQYQDAYRLLESSLEHKYRKELSDSEKKTLLEIFKLLSANEGVEINNTILEEIKDIDLIREESLPEKICNTEILRESSTIATLDYLDKIKNNKEQTD